ncbi:hypothetical protein [Nocardia terpenica]|uniref:Uncharacterized protein n=1 Tax=Nocardia terpenica TaxID=455432 RepID=A0A291RDA3_9NOCA|nr:hypothetical protein [Nocardia terpenica]ATL65092.1 hypothetical protein CRH09_01465 [Nocardia terpenica]
MTTRDQHRRKQERDIEWRDEPDPGAGDWMDWEGITVPDWGYALVDVRGGTVRIAIFDYINDCETLLTLLPEQAIAFADWVTFAAYSTAENLARILPRLQPD